MTDKTEQQAHSAILNFLKELNVEKIVYVDDRCSINELKEAFIGKLLSHYNSSKPEELDFVDWSVPLPVFKRNIKKTWEAKNDEERREVFLEILKFENNSEELENSVAPLRLKKVLKDKIDLLSPTEWVANKSEFTENLNKNSKKLFLFDIDFGTAPLSDGRDGRDLALELLQDNQISDFLYCGIFSHLFNVEEEYEKREEYCDSHKLDKNKFYTISKKRFKDDSYLPGLAEGIRNTLLINEVEVLKKETSNILKASFNSATKKINDLNPESFNHIIQKSSRGEGVWEMDTLIRLSNIITTDSALNSLLSTKKRTTINEVLKKIRKVEKVKTGGETPFDKTQVYYLRSKEMFTQKEVQNQLHYPLSNGDIFKIEEKEYILLVQPCNIAMRSNGSRDRRYNLGFLVNLEVVEKEKYDNYKKGQLSTLEIIEDYSLTADSVKIARFSTFQSVSLSPLDLTVFNKDGIARIKLGDTKNHSTTIQESWKKRYKNIHKEFLEYGNSIKIYRRLRVANKESLKKSIYNSLIFSGYDINNENALSRKGVLLKFNIQRIGHYKSPYSDDLLQKFMQYLSRNAFNHDFTT